MGEIGFSRREFLYDIKFWEARRILRGYYRRQRDMWSATRWQTYRIMEAQIGSNALAKAGIQNPIDLLPFPWEKAADSNLPTEEEIADMQAEMDAMNKQLQEQSK